MIRGHDDAREGGGRGRGVYRGCGEYCTLLTRTTRCGFRGKTEIARLVIVVVVVANIAAVVAVLVRRRIGVVVAVVVVCVCVFERARACLVRRVVWHNGAQWQKTRRTRRRHEKAFEIIGAREIERA